MPKKRKRSDPSPDEVVSSSEETMSSGEETDSAPSPPPPRAPKGTPGRTGHDARRNAHCEGSSRQPFTLSAPQRPRPSNSERQMTRLDVNWEVRQLERARRQQPESFGRMRPAVRRSSVPAQPSTGYSRRNTLARARLLEELTNSEEHDRLEAIRRRLRESRRPQARAEWLLAYDNARTTLRI
jgi:hypothetical protein